mmetsp:Transcript_43077/g.108814  ORF Transcript_43077/g.108814 Transcript_43077/m.108814 type:complete len:757 (+) Transcript_43077:112-2382(+)|eukprot:CAMPEP_0177648026 /NCGR_PEP_ID=MMETSP0447-20121125/10610_1 /TAXON_ID=0 /ORGANISM="Stygamoeba regulata, Strain BSH-02190019" /LENGTH=756 /DNA_ID=CAMNT_0019150643 /DNA_START=170 /DNA_END=2440 /DNA_ORIENTATION=+
MSRKPQVVMVSTNLFLVDIPKNKGAEHYFQMRIDFVGKHSRCAKKEDRRDVVDAFFKSPDTLMYFEPVGPKNHKPLTKILHYLFDGMNIIYTNWGMKENHDSEELEMEHGLRFNFNPQLIAPSIKIMEAKSKEVLMREFGAKEFGKSICAPPLHPSNDRGATNEVWEGSNYTFLATENGPAATVLNKAVLCEKNIPLLDYIELTLRSPLSKLGSNRIALAIIGLRVTNLFNKHSRRVMGCTKQGALALSFEGNDGVMTNVCDFFEKTYSVKMRHPCAPCVTLKAKNRCVFWPIEACMVAPGQRVLHETERDREKIIAKTSRKPHDMLREAQTMAGILNSTVPLTSLNPITTKAFVMEPPTLEYSNRRQISNRPSWNMRDLHLLNPQPLVNWIVLYHRNVQMGYVRKFIEDLRRTAHNLGMASDDPMSVSLLDFDVMQTHTTPIRLALALLPDKNNDKYLATKEFYDMRGISSQVSVFQKRLSLSYLANLLLKINNKLAGVNTTVPAINEKFPNTLFMGMDVWHAPPGQIINSIAAMVGFYGPDLASFCWDLLSVDPRKEQVDEKVSILVESCLRQVAKNAPNITHVIFYRDGVALEMQEKVRTAEIPALRSAFKKVLGREVQLIYMVVNKRQPVRFFKVEGQRIENPSAGTLVCSGITLRNADDFFLVSHRPLQGTSKPRYYTIITNDACVNNTILYQLTYDLCYLLTRATCAVSMPAPVYYAHLAAYRARKYYREEALNQFRQYNATNRLHMWFN